MIALAGNSGSGKATLANGLARIFGPERSTSITLDDYHSLDRAQRAMVRISAADPRASNFAAMEEDLWALREGRVIEKPVYDHATGTFAAGEQVEPRQIVIVRGLFSLYTRALRSLFDVTVWLEPEEALHAAWVVARDVRERGYTEEAARAELQRRAPEAAKHIGPEAKYADLAVTFFRNVDGSSDRDPSQLSVRIRKGGRLRPLDYAEFASPYTSLRQQQSAAGGFPETVIEIDGHISPDAAAAVEDNIWSHIEIGGAKRTDGLGEFLDLQGKTRTGHALALSQLLIGRRVSLIAHDLEQMG